MEMMIY